MSQRPKSGPQPRAASTVRPPMKEETATPILASPGSTDEAEPVMDLEPAAELEPIAPEAVIEPAAEVAASAFPAIPEPVVTEPILPEPTLPEPMPAAEPEVAAATVEPATVSQPTKTTLTQGMKTMMKSTEDFVAFGQANLEAFVKSGQIWSAGVQELTKQFASSAKASFDESVSTFKAISTAKSVKEAMDLQSTFAKAALEKAMAESNKLTDASIKLTEQTLAPITANVTVAVEDYRQGGLSPSSELAQDATAPPDRVPGYTVKAPESHDSGAFDSRRAVYPVWHG